MYQLKCIITIVIIFSIHLNVMVSSSNCDTKQIRLMYLLACGAKKKRGGVEFYEELESAQRNSRRSSVGNLFLRVLADDTEDLIPHSSQELQLRHDMMRGAVESLKIHEGGVALGGMTKGDSFHVLSDLLDADIANNEVRRREVNELIAKCCKSSCSARDFINEC